MPAITVVIVNHDGKRFLPDCLNALASQSFTDFEAIVVDNGSGDGSLELIGKDFPWVKVVGLDSNTGFARGNNIGLKAAGPSKYIATLNNDTIADRDWLQALYTAAEADGGVGMVASKIFLGEDGLELDSAGMLLYPDGMTRQRGRGETDAGQYDGGGEVLFPSACAALYRFEMIEQTGFFDEDFFLYCEDADLGLRARLAGWKAVLAPGARVRHLYSRTGGEYSDLKAFHVERNRLWVLLKNLPAGYVLTSPLFTLWRYLLQIYGLLTGRGSTARYAEKAGGFGMIRVISKAYWGALTGLFRTLEKRGSAFGQRRVPVGQYKALLKKHRITAKELVLRD